MPQHDFRKPRLFVEAALAVLIDEGAGLRAGREPDEDAVGRDSELALELDHVRTCVSHPQDAGKHPARPGFRRVPPQS